MRSKYKDFYVKSVKNVNEKQIDGGIFLLENTWTWNQDQILHDPLPQYESK